MKLTKEYPHFQFVKESDNEADKTREQVQFYGKINWSYVMIWQLNCFSNCIKRQNSKNLNSSVFNVRTACSPHGSHDNHDIQYNQNNQNNQNNQDNQNNRDNKKIKIMKVLTAGSPHGSHNMMIDAEENRCHDH